MKKTFKNRCVVGGMCGMLASLMLATLASCAFSFQSPNDVPLKNISGQLQFNSISRQGFMGGSVLYNPDQPSSGQLANGVVVAVRLGKVERQDVGNDQSVFSDKGDEARYGYIAISGIDKKGVEFTYTEYDATGVSSRSAGYSLAINETADINGDGLADLTYAKPNRKRPGMENAIYLTFLSSQETLNTAMFAVLPEQYSRSVYPSGIIGINPDGRFIVSKYEVGSTNRAAVQGVVRGDYVLDSKESKYQIIVSASASRNARAISDTELADVEQSNNITLYQFSERDFSDGYDAKMLFDALPYSVKVLCQTEQPYIQKLNELLANRNLITLIAQTQETPIPADVLPEVVAQFDTLPENEVFQINRVFLEEMYPDLCPVFFDPSEGFAQAVPLASIIIGDNNVNPAGYQNNSRAATLGDYNSEKSAIDARFSGFKSIKIIDLSNYALFPNTDDYKANVEYATLKLGIKGSFTNVWGNIGASIESAVYIAASVTGEVKKSYSTTINLLTGLNSIVL